VSLYSIVSHGLSGRLRPRRDMRGVDREAEPVAVLVDLPGGSMRLLETGLAVAALATALLLGLGH
jgi:hypothetical protein